MSQCLDMCRVVYFINVLINTVLFQCSDILLKYAKYQCTQYTGRRKMQIHKLIVVTVIVSVFNTFERQMHPASAQFLAVIWESRRKRKNKLMHRECAFTTRVNIFGMTEKNYKKTHNLSSLGANANLALNCSQSQKDCIYLHVGPVQWTEAATVQVCQSGFLCMLSHFLKSLSQGNAITLQCHYIKFWYIQDASNEAKRHFYVVAGLPRIIGGTKNYRQCSFIQGDGYGGSIVWRCLTLNQVI